MKSILRLLSNILGVWVAFLAVPGFIINGGAKEFLMAGALLWILNLVFKPIIKFISAPLILLTLGLFTFIINAFLILLVDYLLAFVIIQTYTALFWTTIIAGLINLFSYSIIKSLKR